RLADRGAHHPVGELDSDDLDAVRDQHDLTAARVGVDDLDLVAIDATAKTGIADEVAVAELALAAGAACAARRAAAAVGVGRCRPIAAERGECEEREEASRP